MYLRSLVAACTSEHHKGSLQTLVTRKGVSQDPLLVLTTSATLQAVETAAPTGQGLTELEEAILLQAEMMDLKASQTGAAEGTTVEARMTKGQGPVATVIVKRGALKVRCLPSCAQNAAHGGKSSQRGKARRWYARGPEMMESQEDVVTLIGDHIVHFTNDCRGAFLEQRPCMLIIPTLHAGGGQCGHWAGVGQDPQHAGSSWQAAKGGAARSACGGHGPARRAPGWRRPHSCAQVCLPACLIKSAFPFCGLSDHHPLIRHLQCSGSSNSQVSPVHQLPRHAGHLVGRRARPSAAFPITLTTMVCKVIKIHC